MKSLIVFYSRKGTTKKIAELIGKELDADIEELIDLNKRTGFIIGFLKCGLAATKEKLTDLKEPEKDPSLYDLVILGTPIWNKRMTPAIRTYIHNNKEKFKKVAFFCTYGGRGSEELFNSMKELIGIEPISTLDITRKEIKKNLHLKKIQEFLNKLM